MQSFMQDWLLASAMCFPLIYIGFLLFRLRMIEHHAERQAHHKKQLDRWISS
jgi:hypothetical protein